MPAPSTSRSDPRDDGIWWPGSVICYVLPDSRCVARWCCRSCGTRVEVIDESATLPGLSMLQSVWRSHVCTPQPLLNGS